MVAKSNEEMRGEVNEMLLLFVDFIYALVFWQIVSEVYDKIIEVPITGMADRFEKAKNFLAVLAIFYFLAWDWISGRILTIKNPYRGFTRFFTEITIAFCAYGAVLQIVNQKVFFLWYVMLMLFLGVVWAKRTLNQYPDSGDRHELEAIIRSHIISGIVALSWFLILRFVTHSTLSWPIVITLVILEWVLIALYEVFVPRAAGILGGAQMALISRRRAGMVRDRLKPLLQFLTKKKGDRNV